jgi:hypothetical protein
MIEIWKPIPGYKGYYSASNSGRVRSENRTVRNRKYRSKILVPGIDTYGYEIVTLCKNGRRTRTVHQLVLETFSRPKIVGEEANHKDANKRNNKIENLEWVDSKEHDQITQRQGRMPRGEQVNTSKLNEDQVREIREKSALGIAARALAREYQVRHSSILAIIKRKNWKHI